MHQKGTQAFQVSSHNTTLTSILAFYNGLAELTLKYEAVRVNTQPEVGTCMRWLLNLMMNLFVKEILLQL